MFLKCIDYYIDDDFLNDFQKNRNTLHLNFSCYKGLSLIQSCGYFLQKSMNVLKKKNKL